MTTQSFYDGPGKARKPCPRPCGKYVHVRNSICPACDFVIDAEAAKRKTEREIKKSESEIQSRPAVEKDTPKDTPKPPKPAVPRVVSQTGGLGKKHCPGCNLYCGSRSHTCGNCGHSFIGPEGESVGSGTSSTDDGYELFRQTNNREGYFVFTSKNGIRPPGHFPTADDAHLALIRFSQKDTAVNNNELSLLKCETEEAALTAEHGVLRTTDKKIRTYLSLS